MSACLALGYTQEFALLLCKGLLPSVWPYCVVGDDDLQCEQMIDHHSYILHNLSSCEITPTYYLNARKNNLKQTTYMCHTIYKLMAATIHFQGFVSDLFSDRLDA